MAMYTVTTGQLMAATILSALISAGSIVGYTQFKERQARTTLPEVQVTMDDKCTKVVNFKNGDAYNCEDVDVLLREYNKKIVMEPKPAPEPPQK